MSETVDEQKDKFTSVACLYRNPLDASLVTILLGLGLELMYLFTTCLFQFPKIFPPPGSLCCALSLLIRIFQATLSSGHHQFLHGVN